MNVKQQAFVCEMLRHGNKAEAYMAAYKPQSDNPRSIESAANRLMKDPQVAEAIQTVQDRIYAEVQQELKSLMLREALTVQRKREILAQIAEGEWMMQAPPANIEGKPTAVFIPTLKERLKAIDMDNRMTGAYVATKPVKPPYEEHENGNKTQQVIVTAEDESPDMPNDGNEIIAPAPGNITRPFILPFIESGYPRLNRSTVHSLHFLPDMTELLPVKPAWLQTIRV